MKPIPTTTKTPLYPAFIIQISALMLFTCRHVKAILPEGNSLMLDWIYQHESLFVFTHIALSILFCLIFLLGKRPLAIRIGAAVFFLVVSLINATWLTGWLYPLLALAGESASPADRSSSEQRDRFARRAPETIGLAVLVGGMAMMTIQIPFPHETFHHTIYIQSLSTVVLAFTTAIYLFYHSIVYFLLRRVQQRRWLTGRHLFLPVLFAGFFILFAVYSLKTFEPFIRQFNLSGLPFLSAGILTTLLFMLFGTPDPNIGFKQQLFYLIEPLVRRFFWLKFIALVLVIRQFYGWLLRMDQNFLAVFLYDLANALVPIIIFWLSLGLVFKVLPALRRQWMIRAAAWPLFILMLVPAVHYSDEDWTFRIETNRPPAQFTAFAGRTILGLAGVDTTRDADRNRLLLEELITDVRRQETLSADTVFFHQPPSPIPLRWKGDPPHIFIILADAAYAGRFSIYGGQNRVSPELAKFAEEAVVFDHFYTTSSATALAVPSIFTGRYTGNYPPVDGYDKNTLCRSLKQNGYELVLSQLIKSVHLNIETAGCQSDPYISYQGTAESDWRLIEKRLAENGRPLLVYFHLLGGHDPWLAAKVDKQFHGGSLDLYDGLLHESDRIFGDFIKRIKNLGIYDRSVIIFSSDHGVGLGHHLDQVSYSNLYNVNMHIPFLIRIPGVRPGRVDDPFSLVDIRPSLERLLSIPPAGDDVHGQSFLRALENEAAPEDKCVFGVATYADIFAMQRADGLKIVYNRGLRYLEAFNSYRDPNELNSIGGSFTVDEFRQAAKPLARFMVYGADSYSR